MCKFRRQASQWVTAGGKAQMTRSGRRWTCHGVVILESEVGSELSLDGREQMLSIIHQWSRKSRILCTGIGMRTAYRSEASCTPLMENQLMAFEPRIVPVVGWRLVREPLSQQGTCPVRLAVQARLGDRKATALRCRAGVGNGRCSSLGMAWGWRKLPPFRCTVKSQGIK